jgi:hypothetical protein
MSHRRDGSNGGMFYDEHLIDTLDRRLQLVASSEGRTLLLECRRFVQW